MPRSLLRSLVQTVLVLFPVLAFAQAQAPTVASTSWTAAMARAAGASPVVVIAPAELRHPPEYEIKPSDLDAVRGARLVVSAGYEKFARRLVETSGSLQTAALTVVTSHVPAVVIPQVKRIAEALGTLATYESWATAFERFASASRLRVQAAYPDRRAAVQVQFKAYAEWLGFEVVGVFGPGELSPAVVLDLVKLKPAVVIDNFHNPSGPAVAEALQVPYVTLINFPGKDGSASLEDVATVNEKALVLAGKR